MPLGDNLEAVRDTQETTGDSQETEKTWMHNPYHVIGTPLFFLVMWAPVPPEFKWENTVYIDICKKPRVIRKLQASPEVATLLYSGRLVPNTVPYYTLKPQQTA